MSSVEPLKQLDTRQLFRLFVDGRFQNKKQYQGWVGYEKKEPGSVQAMLNALTYMVENLFHPEGLRGTYLRELHRIAMFNVTTPNQRASPGDIRFRNTGLPCFKKTTTLANLEELIEMRRGDGTVMFHDSELAKTADNLSAKKIYAVLQKKGKVLYRAWYPTLSRESEKALDGDLGLTAYYQAKHTVQLEIVARLEEIVEDFNRELALASISDRKLDCIALMIRRLEALHPFPDGNCRVFACVILTQLLVENGFPPAMLLNPNLDFEYSLAQWRAEIDEGMERTRLLLNNPELAVFGFGIDDMTVEHQFQFVEMASQLKEKLEDYSEIYLSSVRVQQYTNGRWYRPAPPMKYTGVGTHGTFDKGYIYFALSVEDWEKAGKDIAKELQKVVDAGVRTIVTDAPAHIGDIRIPVLVVDNVLDAFNQTAYKTRQSADPTTILITGTEGKTSTKIQIHHLLSGQTKVHAWLNSLNTVIPIHRSLASIGVDDCVEITEVSVDANQEKTATRAGMVNPDICFFSNISAEHMHVHQSMEKLISNKAAVIEGLREGGKCIVNGDMETTGKLIAELRRRRPGVEILTFGISGSQHATLVDQKFNADRLVWEIEAEVLGESVKYVLPLIQNHAPLTSVGALLCVKSVGYDLQIAARDYAEVKPYSTMGALASFTMGDGKVLVYDQSRRASIAAVRSAFKDLKNFSHSGKVVALLGSVSSVKDNDWTHGYHKELAGLINESDISRLYTSGPNMTTVVDNLSRPELFRGHSDNLDELYARLIDEVEAGDLIFIQGYLRLNLSKVAQKLLSYDGTVPSSGAKGSLSKADVKVQDFDPGIAQMGLDAATVRSYSLLMASSLLDTGRPVTEITGITGVSTEDVTALGRSGGTWGSLRGQLLESFFSEIGLFLGSQFGMRCVDEQLRESGLERWVVCPEFCSSWFNNNLAIAPGPTKHLFGSFFQFTSEKYLFHVLAGSTNLHVGLVKYRLRGGKYELLAMSEADFSELAERYQIQLPEGYSLRYRKWAYKWASVDLGTFHDPRIPDVYLALKSPHSSDTLMRVILPLALALHE